MTSLIAIQRAKNALEKQDTNKYTNLNDWDFEDALNKGLSDWLRRQHHGMNLKKEGDEETEIRIDDLQVLLKSTPISVNQPTAIYNEISRLPKDYRYYKKLTPIVTKGNCKEVTLKSFLVEEANTDHYLKDYTMSPSFDFEETFHTMLSNKFRIYHNNDFVINEVILTYYRNPSYISCDKKDFDKVWEWKDDVAELIIDEAIGILAGNIEHQNAYELATKRTENNN